MRQLLLLLCLLLPSACSSKPVDPPSPIVEFAVIADPQLSDSYGWTRPDSVAAVVVSTLEALGLETFCLGDQSEGGTPAELLRWKSLSDSLVVHNIPGNHESRNILNYQQIIDSRDLYSVKIGPVLFVLFDTGVGLLEPERVRAEFLAHEDDPEIRWRIMGAHHQCWSNNTRNGAVAPVIRTALLPIMEEFQVHLYFSGHGHAYERHFVPGWRAGWVEQTDGTWRQGRLALVIGGSGAQGTYSTLLATDIVDPGGTLGLKYDNDDGEPWRGNHILVVSVYEDYLETRVLFPDGKERGDRTRVRLTKPPEDDPDYLPRIDIEG